MLSSFFKACLDLFRPRILGFVIVVPLVSAVLWFVSAYFLFQLLGPQIENYIQGIEWLSNLGTSFLSFGIVLGSALSILVLLFLIFPLTVWTSIVLMAVFAMPWILRALRPQYPMAFQTDARVSILTTWNITMRVFLLAIPIYIVLMLLAWVPYIYVLGTFILSAWVNAYFISAEILSEVMSASEMRTWIRERRMSLFMIGCSMVALLFVPIVQWITPVFGGLWFAHFILAEISQSRKA